MLAWLTGETIKLAVPGRSTCDADSNFRAEPDRSNRDTVRTAFRSWKYVDSDGGAGLGKTQSARARQLLATAASQRQLKLATVASSSVNMLNAIQRVTSRKPLIHLSL
jgi:hypothetical protein